MERGVARLRVLSGQRSRLLRLGVLSCCCVVGLLLVDLDAGPTLWTVGSKHGVSVVDFVGIVLILTGWLGSVATVRWRVVTGLRALSPRAVACVAVAGAGAYLLVSSIFVADFTGAPHLPGSSC